MESQFYIRILEELGLRRYLGQVEEILRLAQVKDSRTSQHPSAEAGYRGPAVGPQGALRLVLRQGDDPYDFSFFFLFLFWMLEEENRAARRGGLRTMLGTVTLDAGNFQSASRGRQRAAWTSQGPPPRSPEFALLGAILAWPRLPGQELTCPVSLRFEKGLPYSLPLGFLRATRGVRGRVSFNPISAARS